MGAKTRVPGGAGGGVPLATASAGANGEVLTLDGFDSSKWGLMKLVLDLTLPTSAGWWRVRCNGDAGDNYRISRTANTGSDTSLQSGWALARAVTPAVDMTLRATYDILKPAAGRVAYMTGTSVQIYADGGHYEYCTSWFTWLNTADFITSLTVDPGAGTSGAGSTATLFGLASAA